MDILNVICHTSDGHPVVMGSGFEKLSVKVQEFYRRKLAEVPLERIQNGGMNLYDHRQSIEERLEHPWDQPAEVLRS